jgi:hypothetical protein
MSKSRKSYKLPPIHLGEILREDQICEVRPEMLIPNLLICVFCLSWKWRDAFLR